jgi:hypothetical protein
VSKSGSSTDQAGGSQEQTRPRIKTLAYGEAKPDAERNPEEITVEQNKVPRAKTKDQERGQH